MGKQAARQAARRSAAAAQARLMQEGLERDKRCAALGVQVLAALRERDRLVEQAELAAGHRDLRRQQSLTRRVGGRMRKNRHREADGSG